MLSFTSWIRLIRNTTSLGASRNNESIDHLRSNQGRSQDFSRGTHIFLLYPPHPPPPSHHHHYHLKNPNLLIPWLKMRLRCKPNRFFLYMKWQLLNSLSPYWVYWLKVLKLVSPIFVCKWLISFTTLFLRNTLTQWCPRLRLLRRKAELAICEVFSRLFSTYTILESVQKWSIPLF